ncbi:Isoprenylcysteine carboxyl methyltransferase (ICMT) family domain containing protein [Elaphomyces granulatus]
MDSNNDPPPFGVAELLSRPSWQASSSRPGANGSTSPPDIDPSNYPGGKKSLSGISIRAFLLGTALGISASLTVLFLVLSVRLWRVSFFVASLCLFHFLEYYVTARYNTRHASVGAFLLTSNGWAYNVAHGSAITECILSHFIFPEGYFWWTRAIGSLKLQLILGLLLVIVGQTVRSLAMAHAGSNFNHTVQVVHKDGHTMVTDGVYRILRHPSYFGFFWWSIGTQLVLENTLCFWAYALILRAFFSNRIQNEERLLIRFFHEEYLDYMKRTWVGIPGLS